MSQAVVDASVAVAYLLGEGDEAECEALRGEPHSPALIDVETTQTLRGLLRGGKIDVTVAERGRSELAELAIRRHQDAALLARAWDLRDVCTVYDALYVALAEALDAPLLTRDQPLARGLASSQASCEVRVTVGCDQQRRSDGDGDPA